LITATVLAACFVLLGTAVAFFLGRSAKGFWPTIGVLALDALMGFALCIALFVVFSICQAASLCAKTTSDAVWSLAYPLVFVPGYWLATLLPAVWKQVILASEVVAEARAQGTRNRRDNSQTSD
jgi:hypothetical protein